MFEKLLTTFMACILCVVFTCAGVNTLATLYLARQDVYQQQVSWERYLKCYWHGRLLRVLSEIEQGKTPVVPPEPSKTEPQTL